jgi:Heterokaryon incompatibility protein (HET)
MAPETRRGKRGRGNDLEGRPWEPPRQVKRNLGPQSDRLCAQCTKLKLDAVFSGRRPVLKGHVMKKLRPVATCATRAIDSCCLCSLLAALIPLSERQSRGNKLRLLSADRVSSTLDTAVLQLDCFPYSSILVPQPEGENCVRLLKEDSIDFDILLGWLRSCQHEHGETCDLRTSPRVQFLKLIDCHTRRIVPASDNQYLALSYTWGPKLKSVGEDNDLDILPDDLPDTIEDAITVTRNLGFQYLWVDRYCINQQNEKEASAQIRQMDLVYKNAEVTIIAAAGKDPQYGLPGVGRRHRASQPCAKIGEHFLVSALDDLSYCIRDSSWVSRAWTYQEGLLSRRRLIFTDQQVYYECRSKHYTEARLAHLPFRTSQYGRDVFLSNGIGNSPRDIITCIGEYSRKSLTNDSDILNGILGILRAFETGIHATRHCWGVPILSVPPEMIKSATKSGKKILGAQAWGFVAGLRWTLPKPSTRRLGFPSWSWTGWAGPVEWGIDFNPSEEITIDPDIKLSIELHDGQVLDWDTYQQSYDDLNSSSHLTHYICISAWTTPIRLLRRTCRRGRVEYETHIDLEDGSYLHWRFCPTTKEPLAYQLYTGIQLGWKEPQEASWDVFGPSGPLILVVGRVGDRTERVGFGWIDDDYYKLYGPDGVYEHADDEDSEGLLGRNRLHIRKPILAKSSQEIRLG